MKKTNSRRSWLGRIMFAAMFAIAGTGCSLTQPAKTDAATGKATPSQATAAAELVLLGVAGGPTWYGKESPHGISSVLVVDGKAYIVDLGSGAYRQLRRAGIQPGSEAAVFFTHLHTDHVIDLASMLMYDPSARRRAKAQLEIFGPGRRGVLPPLADGMKGDVVVHPENPNAGTADLVDAMLGGMAADLNIRVRSEGVPDVRQFFKAHDIALPAGLLVDPNTNPAPPHGTLQGMGRRPREGQRHSGAAWSGVSQLRLSLRYSARLGGVLRRYSSQREPGEAGTWCRCACA